MRGARSAKERVDRRPSYPSDQWVKKLHATTKVWVKVAMAVAYVLSVSLVALGLAVYYVAFWTPTTNTTACGRRVLNGSQLTGRGASKLANNNPCSRRVVRCCIADEMAGGITETGEPYSPYVGMVYMFNLIVGTEHGCQEKTLQLDEAHLRKGQFLPHTLHLLAIQSQSPPSTLHLLAIQSSSHPHPPSIGSPVQSPHPHPSIGPSVFSCLSPLAGVSHIPHHSRGQKTELC
ncbi:hypothetical protein ACEWY4_026457 [Coilia grayii]|uniref:Uncharacterized protein n=1 Tax=Coilia grayii TaxID=363190 RepID=A0ABD1IUX4_9TELE